MFLQLCTEVLHHSNHNSCAGFREALTVFHFSEEWVFALSHLTLARHTKAPKLEIKPVLCSVLCYIAENQHLVTTWGGGKKAFSKLQCSFWVV